MITVYFTSNGRKLFATVNAFHFANYYLWLTIGEAVHMFNDVDTFLTKEGFLSNLEGFEDVTELIKAQSCARYDVDQLPALVS